jgi:hypothetical protein
MATPSCLCEYVQNPRDESGHSTACMQHPMHAAKARRAAIVEQSKLTVPEDVRYRVKGKNQKL